MSNVKNEVVIGAICYLSRGQTFRIQKTSRHFFIDFDEKPWNCLVQPIHNAIKYSPERITIDWVVEYGAGNILIQPSLIMVWDSLLKTKNIFSIVILEAKMPLLKPKTGHRPLTVSKKTLENLRSHYFHFYQ